MSTDAGGPRATARGVASPMTPERWRRIEAVLDEVLDRPAGERAEHVARLCAGDDALRREVERLLAAHDDTDGPLASSGDRPAAAFAAPLVARTMGGDAGTRVGADDAPMQIGPWRIVAQAGQGGMGTVYLAERADAAFRMRVALKLLRRGLDADASFLRRFREEREILARLSHPNVARLLDGGVSGDGRPYYVMEFVDGAPITAWCDARSVALDARLALFAKVCDAVAEAHDAHVVHRDLKPGNILVTDEGEPKLVDFGIAKLLVPDEPPPGASAERTAAWALTRTGQRLLTPAYASPEQLRGEPVTEAADVWALGVVLYELLVGAHPFASRGLSEFQVERAILEAEPSRPSRVAPGDRRRALRGDLDAIVMMALRKEPARRYDGAAELARDVRRHLAGAPVRARGDGAGYRARKWLARHRVSVAAAALGAVAGVAAIAVLGGDEPAAVTSAVAQRYYEDGLRAFAAGTFDEATRLFRRALAEDSTFALAAYHGAESASRDEDYAVSNALLSQAMRHSARLPERDRLLVRAYHADRLRLPALAAYADSLVQRHPTAAEGMLRAARAAMWSADYATAVERFRRVVTLDSASLVTDRVPCHACEALQQAVSTQIGAGDFEGAWRDARRLTELRPRVASSWRALAIVALYSGEASRDPGGEGERAYRRVVELDPSAADWAAEWLADRHMRAADFHSADAILRARAQTAPAGRQERSLGLLVTSLRNQARWDEALEVARRYRAAWAEIDPSDDPTTAPAAAALEATVLLESGRLREAVALRDSIARWRQTDSIWSSERIWRLGHLAHALAVAGDTAALHPVIDTLRVIAPRSLNARDGRMHHYASGLLLAARGEDAAAVAELRRAMTSANLGYTRVNLALASSLMRLGRAADAVAVLQPALLGSLEVSNSYTTHAEVHAALAEAWRAAGNADSAAAHAEWVRRARGSRR